MGCCNSKNRVADVNQEAILQRDQIRKRETESNKNQVQTEQFRREIKPEQEQQIQQNKFYDEQSEINEWKALIQKLESNTDLKSYALAKKRRDFSSLMQLIEYLKAYSAKSDIEKAYLIYVWITDNIEYDGIGFRDGNLGDNDPESVFRRGKCVCEGYASLYQAISKWLGVDCIKISGYSKGFGYEIGKKFHETDHAWNAVKINNRWRLVESTWGAGNLDNFIFKKSFNPYYFFTPPHVFIFDHYSENYHYLSKQISLSDFEHLPTLNLKFFLYGLKCLSHSTAVLNVPHNPLFIEFGAPKETIILASLYRQNGQKIEDSTIIQRDAKTNKLGIITFVPQKNESYIFKMYAKSVNDAKEKLYTDVCAFKVIRTGDQAKLEFPRYEIEHDLGIKCLSHYSQLVISDRNPLYMEFSVPRDVLLLVSLYDDGNQEKKDSVTIQRDSKTTRVGMIIFVPEKNRKHILKIYAKNERDSQSNSYPLLTEYLLYRNSDQISYEFPKFNIEHNFNIKCLSHYSQLIYTNENEINFEFSIPDDVFILANLKINEKDKLEDFVLFQKNPFKNNITEIKVSLPNGYNSCALEMFAKKGDNSGSYGFLTKYKILYDKKINSSNDRRYLTKFNPEKINFFIIDPIEKYLGLNKEYEFKLFILNSFKIALVDDNGNWFYFIQDGSNSNIWILRHRLEKVGKYSIFANMASGKNYTCLGLYEVE